MIEDTNYNAFTVSHRFGHDVLKRVEFATAVAQRVGDRIDPRKLSHEVIGPVAQAETLATIARAPSRGDGLTLLLASREFQRR